MQHMVEFNNNVWSEESEKFDNITPDVIIKSNGNNIQQADLSNSLRQRQILPIKVMLTDNDSSDAEKPEEIGVIHLPNKIDTFSEALSSSLSETSDAPGDVAIVLHETQPEEVAKELAAVLMNRKPGLITRIYSLTRCKAILVSASTKALLEWAEDFRLVKRERGTGHLRTFILSQFDQFESSETPEHFFTRTERQRLIQLAIESVRAVTLVETFGAKQVLRGKPIVAHLLIDNVVSHFFPLHSKEELKSLRKRWVASPFTIKQPLDDIASYFDTSIGFYFAWLEFYTKWLFPPAIFGFLVWFFAPTFLDKHEDRTTTEFGKESVNTNSSSSQVTNSTVFILLIVFNTIWFAIYRKFWKRKTSELAFKWGASDHRDTSDQYFAEPRPLFTGSPAINPVTGKPTLYWPSWRRSVVFYCVSVPVTLICLWLMMCASVFCLRLQKYADRFAPAWPTPIDAIINIMPLILFVLILNFFNNIYMTVAIKLNNLENYFSQNDYVRHLQAKMIVFRFFNGFLPLFYTAFYERNFSALQEQVAALVMIRQVASNAVEVLVPWLVARYQQFTLRRMKAAETTAHIISATAMNLQPFLYVRRNVRRTSSNTQDIVADTKAKLMSLNQVEVEALMPEFDDCFEDYLEMFCQLGYVMLFAVAFPPVALWCLLNNLVEIKTDALKMCTVCRRPFARERVRDIGIWSYAFEMLAVGAVVVNVALIATFDVFNELFPPSTVNVPYAALIGVIIVEHAIFALRALANRAIDDVPAWINIELAKREYTQLTSESSFHHHNNKDK